jgi:hypothetical protein
MGLALTSGPLLVAGVVWASPAQADAASYLNDMHNVGIQDFDGGDAALLQVGHKLCNEIWDGDPPAELAPWRCNAPTPSVVLMGSPPTGQ